MPDQKELKNKIYDIQKQLNDISNSLDTISNQLYIEQERHQRDCIAAKINKIAIQYMSTGMSTWETADKIKDYFGGSIWDAYTFVSSESAKKQAQKRYAKYYTVICLFNAGFNNSQISKIVGYTPQRCGQIIRSGVIV